MLRRYLKNMSFKHQAISILKERDEGTMKIVSFFIKRGCSTDAAKHLISLLSETIRITLNNEMKAEGFTEFRSTQGILASRTSGHGSLGKWAELDKQSAEKKIRMLSQFNDGDNERRRGSIDIKHPKIKKITSRAIQPPTTR